MPGYVKYFVIIILGALLFFPMLGQVHLFDWDEINFAECAREMLRSDDYLRAQIDFKPFWEKPPFFIWMQVCAMKLFGVNEYAARFPNAFMGVLTLTTLFYIGKRIVNEKMAAWWVLLYAASWLPHLYFKSGIIDPTFNFFIFLAFFQVYLVRFGEKAVLHTVLAGLFLGLAVMTKGPVAILVAVLAFIVYVIVNKGLWGYKVYHLLLIALAAFLTVSIWFGTTVLVYGWEYGKWFINEFVTYQVRLFSTEDASHGGPFFYHFIILLLGCFPASVFLFQYGRDRVTENEPARNFTKWMWILFWVVLLLFSVVKTKIVHYSSICYFPLTYLAALQLYRINNEHALLKSWVKAILLTIGTLVSLLITALPFVGLYKDKLIPYINDPFAVGNLQAIVTWHWSEALWGLLYLFGIWISVLLMKKNFQRGMILLCALQLLIMQVTILHFAPKIEAYSQRAAIEYFKGFRDKDVYVHVLGYKSYAQLFYTDKKAPGNPSYYDENWLLTGQVDRPTYFITKVTRADEYRAMPQLVEIGAKNGFVFFKRR